MAIGIGILGLAHGHVGTYCQQWRSLPADQVKVVAAWDHDAARARTAAAQHNVELAESAPALLGRKDVDAVVIGSETSMHAALVELAAAARKAIVLQKPIATTLADADRIVAAVASSGVRFTLAWQMRVDEQNLRMREIVQERELGRVYMVRRRHCLSAHIWPWFEGSWHTDRALNRGMWADDAAHAIDFVYWLLGQPQTVSAEIDTLRGPGIPDDHGVAVFRYADGTFAEVVSSFTCVGGENTAEIIAENGVVVQSFGDQPSAASPRTAGAVGLKWLAKGASQWTDSGIPSPLSQGERIAGLASPLLAFLQGRLPPLATAEEGRTVLRMTLACYQSADEGRRVRVADVR
jgi:predicted dehydrogenase